MDQNQSQEEMLKQLKEDFLSTVSHELRTPINNMGIAIQVLKINPDSPHRDFYLQCLETECNRQKALINNLLDFQRLEAGYDDCVFQTIDLQSWLKPFTELCTSWAMLRRQAFHVRIEPTLTTIFSDPDVLERILLELVTNALKFTQPNTGIISLEISSAQEVITFKVCNNGEPIPEEHVPFIFDKFYRAPSRDPWQHGGSGIGLSLVKQFVHQLNGQVKFDSQVDKTCFTIVLPFMNAALPS
jgi:signal transduction histidine kinase